MSPSTSDHESRSGARRVVVAEDVVRRSPHRRGGELDLLGSVVAVSGQHHGTLEVLRPLRVPLELERGLPAPLRRRVDRDALGRLVGHGSILLHPSRRTEVSPARGRCHSGAERAVPGAPQPAEPQAVHRDQQPEGEARERATDAVANAITTSVPSEPRRCSCTARGAGAGQEVQPADPDLDLAAACRRHGRTRRRRSRTRRGRARARPRGRRLRTGQGRWPRRSR